MKIELSCCVLSTLNSILSFFSELSYLFVETKYIDIKINSQKNGYLDFYSWCSIGYVILVKLICPFVLIKTTTLVLQCLKNHSDIHHVTLKLQ